jgi:glutaredoxin
MKNRKMRKWEMAVFGIEGCEYCSELKYGLAVMNIPFNYINISDNEKLGDRIEDIYKCPVYPMVSLRQDEIPQQIVWLPGTSLLHSTSIRVFDTINQLLINIKETYDN